MKTKEYSASWRKKTDYGKIYQEQWKSTNMKQLDKRYRQERRRDKQNIKEKEAKQQSRDTRLAQKADKWGD